MKLTFYPNGQVRVTSQLDPDTFFVFQPDKQNESGMRMQLLGRGNGGSPGLDNAIEYWINGKQYIPGFSAAVVLDCFEKWEDER